MRPLVFFGRTLAYNDPQFLEGRQPLKNENDGLFALTVRLKEQNERLSNEKAHLSKALEESSDKVMDANKTFDYVRKNYCFFRNQIHEKFWNCPSWKNLTYEEKSLREHKETEIKLRKLEASQSFVYDPQTFDRGMAYWSSHYKYNSGKA